MAARSLLILIAILAGSPSAQAHPPSRVTISIVGTSDLHGRIAALPWFSGYLKNLRAARSRDGGAVVLVDGGDMFQGTLESNLGEGASVVAAYNALGYAAATLGNHEFDFGPVGPAPAPMSAGDDAQGALKARAAQAGFPFLAANVVDAKTRRPVAWPNVKPSVLIDAAGVKVGIVGVATPTTGRATLPANVAGLDFLPMAETIARESRKLRATGAQVVIVVAHEGGACQGFGEPEVLDSCDSRSAIFQLARQLPRATVDAIVGGHTHQGIAHQVASVPIIQSYANGRAFGRIDLTVERGTGRLVDTRIEPPRELCPSGKVAACAPGDYEGAAVTADAKLVALIAPAMTEARKKGEERLGVEVLRPLPHRRGEESALGNLLADLMHQARPGSDLTVLNAGGIRAGLPAGPLTYGSLYEAFPFDNVFASLSVRAGELRRLLARSLAHASALPSLSGLRVRARCQAGKLDVSLRRSDNQPIPDDQMLAVTTNDYLATGGDGFFGGAKADIDSGPPMRETMVEILRKRGGTIDPGKLLDAKHPRIELPGPVPLRCGH